MGKVRVVKEHVETIEDVPVIEQETRFGPALTEEERAYIKPSTGAKAKAAKKRRLNLVIKGKKTAPETPLLSTKHFLATPSGLVITGVPEFDEWHAVGTTLCAAAQSVQWCIGDWLNYGGKQAQWGETYTEAVERFKRSYRTVRQAAHVSELIESGRRRPQLPWSHHAEVVSLDTVTADALLDRAVAENWSVREIREAVTAERPAVEPDPFHILVAVGDLKEAIRDIANGWPSESLITPLLAVERAA